MKKLLAVLLALALAFSLAACGGKTGGETSGETESANKVAMITDYGDITDESFNQATYEGTKEFCEANSVPFRYYKPAGDSTAERVAMVDAAVADGYNIIIMPGYAFAGTILEVQDNYADVKFVVLDVAAGDLLAAALGDKYDYNPANWDINEYLRDNVTYFVYQEELCGYMAGYAAVKMGYDHLGFLGGMAVPAVVRYGQGFVQGCDAAAAELGTPVTCEYVYGGQFFGDSDITAYMDTWYKTLGVKVVFACGGSIYTSAAEAAAKVEGAKVIGVDNDQAPIIDQYGADMTVTSAMKGLAATVKTILTDTILNDKWADYGKKISTLGLVSGTEPTANYVQIPFESTKWNDTFTQEDYKALVAKMFDGTIKVSDDTTAMPAVTALTLNVYDNIK